VTPPAAAGDNWYPDKFWVSKKGAVNRPPRYGDLFNTPPLDRFRRPLSFERTDSRTGQIEQVQWFGAFVLSPSCELGAKATPSSSVLIARVKNAKGVNAGDLARIVTGWNPGSIGPTVAFAHFAYLAPVTFSKTHNEVMFVDYHETAWVTSQDLFNSKRIAALDHDARVSPRKSIYELFILDFNASAKDNFVGYTTPRSR
jgi:hypothetical protein